VSDQQRLDISSATPPRAQAKPPHFYAAPTVHPKPGDLCARCHRPVTDPIHLKPRTGML